jgi:type II secretory pathway component PulJ
VNPTSVGRDGWALLSVAIAVLLISVVAVMAA